MSQKSEVKNKFTVYWRNPYDGRIKHDNSYDWETREMAESRIAVWNAANEPLSGGPAGYHLSEEDLLKAEELGEQLKMKFS